ncbi:MAG: hypothetical protein JO333_18660 [Verrucomicrobia bacterium]|nr:hypothetical protein [Verrucomicrobiota bacterium]
MARIGPAVALIVRLSLLTVALSISAFAQESIQPSLAGDQVAELRKVINRSDYNLRLGPVLLDLSASTEIEYNDNINLSDHAKTGDWIFLPQVNLNMDWQATAVNELRLDLGFGYEAYLNHSNLNSDTLLIAPDSLLSFDVYVGDFRFNFHDRLSIQQNPVDTIELSNVARFGRLENSAGVSAVWDLNQVKIMGSYDHYLFDSLDSTFDYLSRSEEQFLFSVDVNLNRTTTIGVRGTAALIDYNSNTVFNDASQFSVGPFLEMYLTPYTRIRASAGYEGLYFHGNAAGQPNSPYSGGFAYLDVVQRLNRYFTQYLNIGYDTELGVTTQYQRTAYARYTVEWRVNSRLNVAVQGFYEHANESESGFGQEHPSLYGGSIFLSTRLATRMTVGFGYLYTGRTSNLPDRSYSQNQFIFRIGYNF